MSSLADVLNDANKKTAIIDDCVKLWIELITPLLVRNVPKSDRQNAPAIRTAFQTRSMFFFSCTITECRNAVATSHGMSAAFSTGSQAYQPPQPTSSYAHFAPSRIPKPRKVQAAKVQRRVTTIQRSSTRLDASAAMAKANGIVRPT